MRVVFHEGLSLASTSHSSLTQGLIDDIDVRSVRGSKGCDIFLQPESPADWVQGPDWRYTIYEELVMLNDNNRNPYVDLKGLKEQWLPKSGLPRTVPVFDTWSAGVVRLSLLFPRQRKSPQKIGNMTPLEPKSQPISRTPKKVRSLQTTIELDIPNDCTPGDDLPSFERYHRCRSGERQLTSITMLFKSLLLLTFICCALACALLNTSSTFEDTSVEKRGKETSDTPKMWSMNKRADEAETPQIECGACAEYLVCSELLLNIRSRHTALLSAKGGEEQGNHEESNHLIPLLLRTLLPRVRDLVCKTVRGMCGIKDASISSYWMPGPDCMTSETFLERQTNLPKDHSNDSDDPSPWLPTQFMGGDLPLIAIPPSCGFSLSYRQDAVHDLSPTKPCSQLPYALSISPFSKGKSFGQDCAVNEDDEASSDQAEYPTARTALTATAKMISAVIKAALVCLDIRNAGCMRNAASVTTLVETNELGVRKKRRSADLSPPNRTSDDWSGSNDPNPVDDDVSSNSPLKSTPSHENAVKRGEIIPTFTKLSQPSDQHTSIPQRLGVCVEESRSTAGCHANRGLAGRNTVETVSPAMLNGTWEDTYKESYQYSARAFLTSYFVGQDQTSNDEGYWTMSGIIQYFNQRSHDLDPHLGSSSSDTLCLHGTNSRDTRLTHGLCIRMTNAVEKRTESMPDYSARRIDQDIFHKQGFPSKYEEVEDNGHDFAIAWTPGARAATEPQTNPRTFTSRRTFLPQALQHTMAEDREPAKEETVRLRATKDAGNKLARVLEKHKMAQVILVE